MLEKAKELILNNYLNKTEERLIDGQVVTGLVDGHEFLSLDNPIYQERILFNLGPKEVICGHSNQSMNMLRFENPVPTNKGKSLNRSDAVFVTREGKQNKILAIFENKIASSLTPEIIDLQIKNVLREVVEKYLIPYYDNYQLLVSDENKNIMTTNNKKPIIHISLMFYWPEVYLQGKHQLIYYLNNSKRSNPSLMLEETGFFCLNLSFSAKDIILIVEDFRNEIKKEPLTLLKDYYKKQQKIDFYNKKISNNFPSIFIIKGNIKRGPWATDTNYSFDCKLTQLYNIPLWNITPDSKINNTRDLNKENLVKQFSEISDTFCHNYYQRQQKVQLNEIYIGTGAKARELSYDFFKTVVVPLKVDDYKFDDWQHNMSNEIMYVSSDMSAIDGQHSTTTILDILNMLSEQKNLMSEEGVGFEEANRIFSKYMKKNGLEKISSVKDNILHFLLNEQLIEINIKGFENPNLAKRNAKNQNNISEHSSFDKFFDSYKSFFKKLSVFFNEKQKEVGIKTYIPITKDAFSLPSFREVKGEYKKLDLSYFISLSSLLQFPIKTPKNGYFSSNISSANTASNWKKSKEFYFENSDFVDTLYNLLEIRMKHKEEENVKSKNNNIDFCNKFVSDIRNDFKNKSFSIVENLKLEGWLNSINMLKNIIPTTEDETVVEDQINDLYLKIEEEINNISTIRKERVLFVGNFIYAFFKNFPKNNIKKIFSTDLKFNLYSLIYLMSLLREQENDINMDIDLFIKKYPSIESFDLFFQQVDLYLAHDVIDIFGQENEEGEKVIKLPLEIGGTEKDKDNDIIQKLYEFVLIKEKSS